MSRVLILHSSFDGQTARIAERVGDVLERQGHSTTRLAFDAPGAFDRILDHDAVIVGAAVRIGHHSRALADRVKKNRDRIATMPNAFFSVCLASAGPKVNADSVEAPLRDFRARTGWGPQRTAIFAGALRYRKYNPVIRLVMRWIVSRAGGDTDTSRDYEYTDWDAVTRFAGDFGNALLTRARAA